jgi:hypothetical protein
MRMPVRRRVFAAVLCVVVPGVLALTAIPAGATAQLFTASLNGAQEVPPVATAATGSGRVYLNAAETMVTIDLSFTGLSGNPTAAHLHGPAGPGAEAGVQIGISGLPAATSGSVPTQTVAITAAQVAMLKSGQMYFNIHTVANGDGEIRGQVGPALSQSPQLFIAMLNGTKESPPNTSTATGIGTVYLNAAETMVTIDLSFAGLAAPANVAHIHGSATGVPGINAGILIGLTGYQRQQVARSRPRRRRYLRPM